MPWSDRHKVMGCWDWHGSKKSNPYVSPRLATPSGVALLGSDGLFASSVGSDWQGLCCPSCAPDCQPGLHHTGGRGPEGSGPLHRISHAWRPPRPSALKFCAGTGHFAQLEDSPSLMLRASPFSVAFFLRQRQIPSVASSFFYTLFSLEGVFRLLGCSQLHLQVPRLSKEESCSLEVKSTKAFSSQDTVLLTPCILFLPSER